MYECPNCAGNLKFDIPSQQMLCPNCHTFLDPYSIHKEKDAQEATDYEVTVFTCPQCAGEIVSEDTVAATFCSFCGAATTLDSRISREKRPKHIIPFSRTKEDCRSAYEKLLKRSIFAPNELKKKDNIEKFRGIYMPYWLYSFEKDGDVKFKGSQSHQEGDYLITEHYNLSCKIDSAYRGISYDASSSFADHLSCAIAPFDLSKATLFTPSFLSGFFADTSDVESWVYEEEAEDMASEQNCRAVGAHPTCRKYDAGSKHKADLKRAVEVKKTNTELAMFPVWFLSCRMGERITYAVVNGQTGEVAADLPVDKKKYIIGSLLLAVPLFFLLNIFFTIKPMLMLIISGILALVCAFISAGQNKELRAIENGTHDKGLLWKQADTDKLIREPEKKKKAEKNKNGKKNTGSTIRTVVALFVSIIICIWQPVSDLFYYAGVIIAMGAVLWTILDMIERYNLLTTRPIPQFKRKGVDEDV